MAALVGFVTPERIRQRTDPVGPCCHDWPGTPERVSGALGFQVQNAIIDFLQGIVSHPDNRDNLPQPLTEDVLRQLYTESLRILYRMLFALYGESRGLLPDVPTYRDGYSITRLSRRAVAPETDPRRVPTSSGRYFELALKALFELLRYGANLGPEGKVPMYDGALFDHTRTTLVESLTWGDDTVANVLQRLTMVETENGFVHLSYRELDVEQLGAIYENLLEQKPCVAAETMYKVDLDGRQLWVNAVERARLAERRGEVAAASSVPEEIEAADEEPDEASEPTEESEDETEEETETPARTRKPIKVVSEIHAGMVYLKAGMGRKQTGSYYTSRSLVEFLVREALDPLADGKTPEEILALSVVDPAMGSGHFLVGACRHLSTHLLAAYRKRYQEVSDANPDMSPSDVFNEAAIHPEVSRNWDYEDQALIACRLLIAGNCVYGVDKNPLAVDLARVSLWLATAALDHPLTFLDHRLRVGDSLVGLPLFLGEGEEPEVHLLKPQFVTQTRGGRGRGRRRQEAPLLAGTPTEELVTQATVRLRERISVALGQLHVISQIMNDSPGDFTGQRAAFEAMQSELRPFWDLHRLRIGQVFLPPSSAHEADLVNRWLTEIARTGHPSREDETLSMNAQQKGEEIGAFCWMLAFPERFFSADGTPLELSGFDVVIGNPPWDKIKPNERECFAEFDPTITEVQGQARKAVIAQICRDDLRALNIWQRYEFETKAMSAFLLDAGLYKHQIATVEGKSTGGDPDMFKFFTERAYQVLRHGGRAGVILPSAIQASLSATALRHLLLDSCRLVILCKLDNERLIFSGVDHRMKFDLIVFEKGGRTRNLEAAFFSWETADVVLKFRSDHRRVSLDADLYRELSPDQYTFVELRDQRDVVLLRRIYEHFSRLGETRTDIWNISFTREFDMSNDSFRFHDAARLREMGAILHSRLPSTAVGAQGSPRIDDDGGEYWVTPDESWYTSRPDRFAAAVRWVDSKGRVHLPNQIDEDRIACVLSGYVLANEVDDKGFTPIVPAETYRPLYEGRMVHQFDHCQKAYLSGSGRRAKWQELGWQEKRLVPHYFVAEQQCGVRPPRLAICLVTGQTNERTALTTLIPGKTPSGHSLATGTFGNASLLDREYLIAVLNSFVIDWILRLQVSSNIGFYHLYGLPIPRSESRSTVVDVGHIAARLCCTTPELKDTWEELSTCWSDSAQHWSQSAVSVDIKERA